MFLTESEYLLLDGVAGKASIDAVDTHIDQLDGNPNAVLTAELIASRHPASPAEITKVLDALVAENVLTSRRMVRCAVDGCAGLTPAEKVEQARADGDEALCDGRCQRDLVPMEDVVEVRTYRIRSRTDVAG